MKESYFNKLRKRVKTLVIPYIFWNLLVVLFYLIVPRILGGFNPENQINNISDVFKAFWCYPYTPINYPLWYMRDLIVLVLLSPLIYLLIKYLKFIPILIFGIVYFASIKLDVVRFDLLSQTLFFFPLGAYFAIEKRNILKCCRSLSFYPIVLYFILIVFDVILKNVVTDKGAILTQMSKFWFNFTQDVIPNHVISTDNNDMPEFFQQERFKGNATEEHLFHIRYVRSIEIRQIHFC